MTNKEKKDWLAAKYPLTVIRDRYDGTYSGAMWLAFPLHYFYIPSAIRSDDLACANFWKGYKEPVGKGAYASDAVKDLIEQMWISEPEVLSKRKVYDIMSKLSNLSQSELIPLDSKEFEVINEITTDVLSLLDYPIVQKPMVSYSVNLTELIASVHEEFRILLKEQGIDYEPEPVYWEIITRLIVDYVKQYLKEQKPLLPEDKVKHPLYMEGFEAGKEVGRQCEKVFEKQKEQKPAEWSEEDKRALKYLHELISWGYAEKFMDAQTAHDMRVWINEHLKSLRPQPKIEWSEEDQLNLNWVIAILNGEPCELDIQLESLIYWLKSLPMRCPKSSDNWKPSEEQMEAFRSYIKDFQDRAEAAVGGWNNFDVMIRLFEQLKKL